MTDDPIFSRRTTPEAIGSESLTADQLEGETVYDRHEGTIGTIRDVAVSEDGRVEVVVVDVGGFLGLSAHNVGISVEKLNVRRGEGDEVRVYLDMTDEEVRNLPQWTGVIPPAVGGHRTP